MPAYVATIEAWFTADTDAEAAEIADTMGDAISDDGRLDDVPVSAIASSVAPRGPNPKRSLFGRLRVGAA